MQYFLKIVIKNKLTHLIVNNNSNLPEYLQEVYWNEEKFEYLDNEFDTNHINSNYHIKLFKINYEKFNLIEE